MKRIIKLALGNLFLLSVFFFVRPNVVFASEGTFELKSTGNEPYRCYAVSIRMLEPEYRILFTCKFILYPAEENVFNYVVWATPTDGKKAIKLGTIGQGRGELKTKTPFSNLFVTTEISKDVKTPTGRVVMKGNVNPIQFLEEAKQYEPTPTIAQITTNKNISPSVSPATSQTTREKFLTAFKRAGVAALVAIVALVGLIFVITRSRG
jgi:hypothetical protein